MVYVTNITVLRRASNELVFAEAVTVGDIESLHAALLPDERHRGLRRVQNWIGGSNWHPLDAEFVPPTPDLVPSLMEDLVAYLNGGLHGPLVQAGLIHHSSKRFIPSPTATVGSVGR